MKSGLLKQHHYALNLINRVLDIAVLICAGIIAWRLQMGVFPSAQLCFGIILLVLPLWGLIFPAYHLYRPWRGESLFDECAAITLALATILIVIVLAALATSNYPDMLIGYWVVLSWTLLVAYRLALRLVLRWMRRRGFNQRTVIVVGAGALGEKVTRQLAQAAWTGIQVAAFFDDRFGKEKGPDWNVAGIPVVGTIDDVPGYLDRTEVDQIWIALPLRAEKRIRGLLENLHNYTADIRYVPDIFGFTLLNYSLTEVAGIPFINLSMSPMDGLNAVVKWVEDRLIALIILILISPLMLFIAFGVKLSSPGPILFKQKRHGWDGKLVEIWKFRSMVVHEEAPGHVTQATKSDKRVTSFGAFLRRSSLDELPQFMNVLQGTMSIVGPRPHAVEHNEFYRQSIEAYMQRHKVKPGITGWAQVNGLRGETDSLDKMKKRIELDLFYIENWSLWFDLRIILKTLFVGFVGKNAY